MAIVENLNGAELVALFGEDDEYLGAWKLGKRGEKAKDLVGKFITTNAKLAFAPWMLFKKKKQVKKVIPFSKLGKGVMSSFPAASSVGVNDGTDNVLPPSKEAETLLTDGTADTMSENMDETPVNTSDNTELMGIEPMKIGLIVAAGIAAWFLFLRKKGR